MVSRARERKRIKKARLAARRAKKRGKREPSRAPATGFQPGQAKVTFRDIRTGKVTTTISRFQTRVTGGTGRGRAPVRLVSKVTKITPDIKAKQERDRATREARAKREAQVKKAESEQRIKQALAERRRKELLAKSKIEQERVKRLKVLGQDVTITGEPRGVFGETAAERKRGAEILNTITTKVRQNQTKQIADSIQSISNKALRGESLTPSQVKTLSIEINKSSNKLTVAQKRAIIQIPKSVGLGVFDAGKALVDFVVVINNLDPVGDLVNVGKRLKIQSDKENKPVLRVLKSNISNFTNKVNNVASFVKTNPNQAALLVGAAASELGTVIKGDITKAFRKDPVRTTAQAVAELLPGTVVKGVKGVARLSASLVKAADKIVFSENKIVKLAERIKELETLKVKTRFDLQELNLLRQQLKIDQTLKFGTSAIDDISKVPNKFQGPIREAQKGLKGKPPVPTDNTVKKLIDAQKKLTDKQKSKAFRKAKAKGAKLTPETQAIRLAELFKSTTAVNKASKIKLTAPEISRFNILDKGVNSLSKELQDINTLLKRGVADKTATRLNQNKRDILKQISRFESISSKAKSQVLKGNTQDKLKILKAVDKATKEIAQIRALRDLQFTLTQLETKLGIGRTGVLEQALTKNKIDFKELEALTSKNFVRGVMLRARALKFGAAQSEAMIRGLAQEIRKLLGRGSFKPTVKVKQRIIKILKAEVVDESKLRKIPQQLDKSFTKRNLKGQSLNKILTDDIKELKRIRLNEILKGERKTQISKVDLDKVLTSNTAQARANTKLKQIDNDVGKLRAMIRILKESVKDVSISKRLRVQSLNEEGKIVNLIKALEKDKIRISRRLKASKPIDVSQTARRQREFAKKIEEEVAQGKLRTVKASKPKARPDDLNIKFEFAGHEIELIFNVPKLKSISPRIKGKKAQARLGLFTQSGKPIFKTKITKKVKSAIQIPKLLSSKIQKGVFDNRTIRALGKRKSIVQQQKRTFQSFRKDVKIKTRKKIDAELKNLNKLESNLDRALALAVKASALNRLRSFVKVTNKTELKISPVTKIDLATQLKLTPVQKLKELIRDINTDIGQVKVPSAPKKRVAVKPPVKPRPPIKPVRPRVPRVSKIKIPKPTPVKPKPKAPKLPTLDFDTKLPRGVRLKFDIAFRERRNSAIPFNRKTNPVIVKRRKLGLPLNKAIRRGFGAVDRTTQASAELIISGVTKAKDIIRPKSLLKKFKVSTAKKKTALKFVERSRNRIDTSGEKRGLLLSKIIKKRRSPKKKTTRKKKR